MLSVQHYQEPESKWKDSFKNHRSLLLLQYIHVRGSIPAAQYLLENSAPDSEIMVLNYWYYY